MDLLLPIATSAPWGPWWGTEDFVPSRYLRRGLLHSSPREVSLLLSICGQMGVLLFWVNFFYEDDGGSSYRLSLLDEIYECGGGFFLPLPSKERQHRWSFSGLSRSFTWFGGLGSCSSFQGLELRPAVTGGPWPEASASLHIGVCGQGNKQRCLSGMVTTWLLCACYVIPAKLRGFLVKWICTYCARLCNTIPFRSQKTNKKKKLIRKIVLGSYDRWDNYKHMVLFSSLTYFLQPFCSLLEVMEVLPLV